MNTKVILTFSLVTVSCVMQAAAQKPARSGKKSPPAWQETPAPKNAPAKPTQAAPAVPQQQAPAASGNTVKRPEFDHAPSEGETAYFKDDSHTTITISQIIDDNTMMIQYTWYKETETLEIQPSSTYANGKAYSRPGIAKGGVYDLILKMPTAGLVDKQQLRPNTPFTADGTYSYTDTLGARRTLRQLRPATAEEAAKLIPETTPAPQPTPPQPATPFRVGETATVTLTSGRAMHGRVISVSPESLSIKSLTQDAEATIRREELAPQSAALLPSN